MIHILRYKQQLFYFSDVQKLQAAKDKLPGSEMMKSERVDMPIAKIRKLP